MQPIGGSFLFPSAASTPLFPSAIKPTAAPSPAASASSWLQNTSFAGTYYSSSSLRPLPVDAESVVPLTAPLPPGPPPPLPLPAQPPSPPSASVAASGKQRSTRPRASDFFEDILRPAPVSFDPIRGTHRKTSRPLIDFTDAEELSVPVIYSSSSDESSSLEDIKRSKKEKRRKKDKKKDKKKEKTRRKSDKEKVLDKELELAKAIDQRPTSNAWLLDTERDASESYFLDVKGDRNNIVFSSIYRGDVPIYFRQRFCIGLAPDERITFNKGGYLVYKYDSDRTVSIARYCGPEQIRRLRTGGKIDLSRNIVSARTKDNKSILQADYMPIDVPGFEEQANEMVDAEKSLEDELQERTRDFNRLVREDPNDLSQWLQFISFQDEFIKLGKKMGESSVLEKKIAIYEKALSFHPNSEELLLGYLECCQRVMEADKLSSLWDRIIAQHPGRMRLWKAFIRFHEGEFGAFSMSAVRASFQTAIQMISKHKTKLQGEELCTTELSLVNLFTQACIFERQGGYIEKAVAIFQAVIELNCFKALNVKTPTAQMASFERFWESEAPRVGEDGAQGWAAWALSAKQEAAHGGGKKKKKKFQFQLTQNSLLEPTEGPQPPDAQMADVTDPSSDTEVYREWLALEQSRELQGWLPLREKLRARDARNDDTLDDPERTVGWEDVRDHLFLLSSDDHKLELIFVYLDFLGLRLPLRRVNSNDENYRDRLQDMEDVGDLFANLASESEVRWEGSVSISDPTKVHFIRNVLSLATRAFPSSVELATSFISFEAMHDVNKARKIAKEFLKANRTDLRLWNEYARGEARNEKVDEARRVYDTALTMSKDMPPQSRREMMLLFRNYVEVIVQHVAEPGSLALHVLTSATEESYTAPAVDGGAVQPTRVVRARKVYNDWLTAARESLSWGADFAHKMVCFAYFEYFTQGVDAAEAISMQALSLYMRAGRENSTEHEQLVLAFVRLRHWHSQKGPSPPGKMRRALEQALSLYPSNQLFLSLYIRGEARSQLENRLRRYFDEKCTSGSSIIVWLFAIRTEISRLGSGPRIRTLFERAAESLSTRDAVVLWRFYLDFEISMRDFDLAKRVYFRAIRRVPWSKLIWTDAVTKLRSSFARQELGELLQLMMEKELRVRTDPLEVELLRQQRK